MITAHYTLRLEGSRSQMHLLPSPAFALAWPSLARETKRCVQMVYTLRAQQTSFLWEHFPETANPQGDLPALKENTLPPASLHIARADLGTGITI